MSDRIQIVEEEGHKILFTNLSGLDTKSILDIFPKMKEISIANRITLNILDISNTHSNAEIRDGSKTTIAEIEAKIGKTEAALIGIRGIQKIIANAISRDIYFARDYDDAKGYLLKRAKKSA